MKAIIADVHGNLEALHAVLDDIAAHGVSEIYSLGDIVGYGPNPGECVDLLIDCAVAVLGNHDVAAVGEEALAMSVSQGSNVWTRRQLNNPSPGQLSPEDRREFLAGLPRVHHEGDFLFLHGGPRDPVNEYLFPEDVSNVAKMEAVFKHVPKYCFMGHTHIPGIFTDDLQFRFPEDIDYVWQLDGRKTLCNVGAVGQPRDGDPRACYVLLDENVIRFRRVEYEIEETIRKIHERDDDLDW